jgi:predicted flap endonuclease-1-like 5' DNA nuclease
MVALADVPGMGAAETRMAKALSFPIGAASPLWWAFGAMTGAGVAYWWLARWTKATNLEAAFAVAKVPVEQTAQVIEIIAESVEAEVEAVEDAVAPVVEVAVPSEVEAETAAPVIPELALEAEPLAADDLTLLTGIGPKLSEALAARGVTRFAQLAAWTAKDLAEVDAALSLKGRAVRDAWVAQAARMAAASGR